MWFRELPVFLPCDCIYYLKVFYVVVQVGAERQFHAEEFFHSDEEVGVFAAEAFQDAGVDQDAEGVLFAVVAELEAADDGAEFALELH